MEHKGISYEFTFREFAYFLFGRKRCPGCGSRLEKRKSYETKLGSELNDRGDPIFVPSIKVKSYKYTYVCESCGAQYTLNELVN